MQILEERGEHIAPLHTQAMRTSHVPCLGVLPDVILLSFAHLAEMEVCSHLHHPYRLDIGHRSSVPGELRGCWGYTRVAGGIPGVFLDT